MNQDEQNRPQLPNQAGCASRRDDGKSGARDVRANRRDGGNRRLAPTEAAHELLATGIHGIQPECVDESSKRWCDKTQALLKKFADINATKKQGPAYKSSQDRFASRCGQCGKYDWKYLNNTEWDELSDNDKKETDVAAMHDVFLTCTAQPAQQCPSLPPSAPPAPATPPPLATTTTEVCGCACKVRVPCTYFRS